MNTEEIHALSLLLLNNFEVSVVNVSRSLALTTWTQQILTEFTRTVINFREIRESRFSPLQVTTSTSRFKLKRIPNP